MVFVLSFCGGLNNGDLKESGGKKKNTVGATNAVGGRVRMVARQRTAKMGFGCLSSF